MILRSRDIPGLGDLTDEHRQQIISQVESMVFWKPLSLLMQALGAATFLAMATAFPWCLLDRETNWWGVLILGIWPAALVSGCFAIYRIVGMNSFFRPAIHSLLESGLPPEVKRPIAPRSLQLTVFVFALFVICLFGSVFLGAGR